MEYLFFILIFDIKCFFLFQEILSFFFRLLILYNKCKTNILYNLKFALKDSQTKIKPQSLYTQNVTKKTFWNIMNIELEYSESLCLYRQKKIYIKYFVHLTFCCCCHWTTFFFSSNKI